MDLHVRDCHSRPCETDGRVVAEVFSVRFVAISCVEAFKLPGGAVPEPLERICVSPLDDKVYVLRGAAPAEEDGHIAGDDGIAHLQPVEHRGEFEDKLIKVVLFPLQEDTLRRVSDIHRPT